MARRPRPATRRPPQKVLSTLKSSVTKAPLQAKVSEPIKAKVKEPAPIVPETHEDDDEDGSSESGEFFGSESDPVSSGGSQSEDEDDKEDEDKPDYEDIDVDAPRVAQWVDEEELDIDEDEEDDESEDDAEGSIAGTSNLKILQNDLSSLPLGALRKAQKALTEPTDASDEEEVERSEDEAFSEDDSASESAPPPADDKGKGKQRAKVEIEKRKSKHAPTEVSSRRPPRRKKIGLEDQRQPARDPRFLPMTGQFSEERFRTQYGFLSDMHSEEMKTLRENLRRARKMLASSPRDLRETYEIEVQRLERAVKRAESMVNRDRKERIEQTALRKARQEEREKQKQGKGAWYMKNADQKELFVRAKYNALEESGGKRAVKKAIERKQKKVGQKEKKRRPFPAAGPTGRAPNSDNPRPNKRQRFG